MPDRFLGRLLVGWLASGVLAASSTSAAAQPAAAPRAGTSNDVPPHIARFLEQCETNRRGAIARLEFELRGLRAHGSRTAADSQREKKIEANLASLHANREPLVPALHFPLEVGAIGRLPRLSCHVDQILDDNRMLVSCRFSLRVRVVKNYQPRLETVIQTVPFLIDGLPTQKFTAGADLPVLDVFRVSGRHTYTSVAGKPITVLVLKPFDMESIKPYFQATRAVQ